MKQKQTVIQLALTGETNVNFTWACAKTGLMKTALLRMLVDSFLEYYKESGGKVVLPLKIHSGYDQEIKKK
jgi:hypothetical protein